MKTFYMVGRFISEGFLISHDKGLYSSYSEAEKHADELNENDKEQYAPYEVASTHLAE